MEKIYTPIKRDWPSIEARYAERQAIAVEFQNDPLKLAAEVAKLRAENKSLNDMVGVAGVCLQHAQPLTA